MEEGKLSHGGNELYFIKKVDKEDIKEMRKEYYGNLTAPMDDMWEEGIIPSGEHFEIFKEDISVGYFVVDGENTLIAFYVEDGYDTAEIFEFAIAEKKIKKAYVSTYDPLFYDQCDRLKRSVSDNTYLYRNVNEVDVVSPFDNIEIKQGNMDELDDLLSYFVDSTGGPEQWLRWYVSNLIENKGLTVFKLGDEIIGTGELRPSKSSEGYANIGMVVAKNFRRRGLATYIIGVITKMCKENGYKAICSTTTDNIGSQKTLEKSGYKSYHRIDIIEF